MFNEEELLIVKEKALEDHIPIIMDDTLEVIKDILIKENPKRISSHKIYKFAVISAKTFTYFKTIKRIDWKQIEKC